MACTVREMKEEINSQKVEFLSLVVEDIGALRDDAKDSGLDRWKVDGVTF